MAQIPAEVQELFTEAKTVVFATANKDAQANCCVVAMKKVIDDETIYLSDQFFKKTLANIKENDKGCVLVMGDKGNAYEMYGTMTYVNEGPEFEEQAAWVNAAFEAMGMPMRAKGGVYMKVTEVFTSCPGPNAGDKIA